MRINGHHYYETIKYAHLLLSQYKDQINNINVFPVPDGDTGTNLYLTVKGIWEKVKSKKISHFGKFAELVSDAALESATGNSGNILASFLYGIYDYSQNKESLSVEELVEAFEVGTNYAYEAVETPLEGTILTAMQATVRTAKKEIEKGNRNLVEIIKKCVDTALKELEKKRVFVPSLVKYDVLDAGGVGFVLILNAWAKSVRHDLIVAITNKKVEIKYSGKYCINLLVRINGNVGIEELKEKLSEIGDSIVVTNVGDLVKIHVHSFNVEKVKDIVSRFGEIVSTKISQA